MALTLLLPLRILQACFSLAVLILSSYVANWYIYSTQATSPPQINFLIFAPIFALLSLAYMTICPIVFPKAFHPTIPIILTCLNTLFTFAGFTALSVFMSTVLFCRGSVCTAARTNAVFSALSFFAWGAGLIILVLERFRTHGASLGIRRVRAQSNGKVVLGGGVGIERVDHSGIDEKGSAGEMGREVRDDVVGR